MKTSKLQDNQNLHNQNLHNLNFKSAYAISTEMRSGRHFSLL